MVRVESLAEAHLHIESLTVRVEQLEREVRDHAQRWDTYNSPLWKRLWFVVDGWSWHDLNAAKRRWRPWHRGS